MSAPAMARQKSAPSHVSLWKRIQSLWTGPRSQQYRKQVGGTWYLVREDTTGMAAAEYWMQDEPEAWHTVLSTERY